MRNVTVRKGDLFTFTEREGEVVAIVNTGSEDVDSWTLLPGQFNKRFGVNRFIKKSKRRGQEIYYQKNVVDAYTGKTRNVITLIVKRHEGEHVELENLNRLLFKLRAFCEANGIQKLYMPKLCCGVHGCDWNNVGNLIRGVFNGSGIQVVVKHID